MIKNFIATAAILAAAPAFSAPVDLTSWTAEGFGGGHNWTVQGAGNDSVFQSVNGSPTVFYGPANAIGNKLSGTIAVEGRSDDDYIGFVLGFQPGDLAATETDFILIDWKRGNQGSYGGTAFEGLAISRVTEGLPDASGAWWHDPLDGVEELQRGATLGSTGWNHGQEYQFDLHFYSNNIQVWVDGTKEIDISGSFSDGRFGFYNYSQASVRYAGITEDVLPPVNPIPEPATWAMMIAGFGLVGAVARRRRTVAA